MIHLTPNKIDVLAIYIVSLAKPHWSEQPQQRQYFLGLFAPGVTEDDVRLAIEKHDVLSKVVGSLAIDNGKYHVSIFQRRVDQGAVYDTPEEACMHLKVGLTYEDIAAGYDMSQDCIYPVRRR